MAKPTAFRISMKPLASGGDCSATAPRFGHLKCRHFLDHFFLGGTFPLREGSSTTTVACGKWSVSMLELRTHGKFRYLLMFSSLVFLINRCINT